jgi:hypothetical protein
MTKLLIDVDIYDCFTRAQRQEWGTFLKTEGISAVWMSSAEIDTVARTITTTTFVVDFEGDAKGVVVLDEAQQPQKETAVHQLKPDTVVPEFLKRYPVGVRLVVLQSLPINPNPAFIRPLEVTVMGSYTVLETDKPGTLTAVYKNENGEVVPPDDIPVWTTSNATAVSISSTSPDGTSVTLAYGVEGQASIVSASTDKDGQKLSSQDTITVLPGEPTTVETVFTPGGPQDVLDPGDSLPLYTWDGTTAPATGTYVQVLDVTAADGTALYTFSGDTASTTNAPAGIQPGYSLYEGTVEAVTPPPPAVVTDTASLLPLYTWDGSTPAATGTFTAVTDVGGASGADGVTPATLYTFSGDTVGSAPTGVQAGYALFAGTPVPLTPAS